MIRSQLCSYINGLPMCLLQFLESDFVIMLFHYDGIVDKWKMFEWSDHVIHVSVANQTKWYVSYIYVYKFQSSIMS